MSCASAPAKGALLLCLSQRRWKSKKETTEKLWRVRFGLNWIQWQQIGELESTLLAQISSLDKIYSSRQRFGRSGGMWNENGHNILLIQLAIGAQGATGFHQVFYVLHGCKLPAYKNSELPYRLRAKLAGSLSNQRGEIPKKNRKGIQTRIAQMTGQVRV